MENSTSKKVKKLHKLIDKYEPECLYCGQEMKLTLQEIGGSPPFENVEKLLCLKCNSIFEIHCEETDEHTKYVGFLFSCRDIYVLNQYKSDTHENQFLIGNHQLRADMKGPRAKHVVIPAFTPDFSDREKLYEKLKLFILFS